MKLEAIHFANSVKAGKSSSEQMFLTRTVNGAECWDMEIVNSVYVRLTEVRTGATVYTSLFNTKWWVPMEGEDKKAAPKKAAPKKSAVKL